MSSKTVSWGDNSQDNLTLTAEEWSGNQTVTVNTPENFYKQRAKSIVFYSKTNSNVAATLQCTQAAATYSWDQASISIPSDSTSPITVVLSTNVSTVANLIVSLVDSMGEPVSWASITSLTAAGTGKWSVKITPTLNEATSRTASLLATLNKGSISDVVAEAKVTQGADYIVNTVESDIVGVGAKGVWTNVATLTATEGDITSVGVPAKGLKNPVLRLKSSTFVVEVTNTYASGRETKSIKQYTGGQIYLMMQISGELSNEDPYIRSKRTYTNSNVNQFYASGAQFPINTLGFNEFEGMVGHVFIGASKMNPAAAQLVLNSNVSASKPAVSKEFTVYPNKLESYDGSVTFSFMGYNFIDSLTLLDTTIRDGLDCIGNYYFKCTCSGTATYSSGSSRSEGRPVVPSVSDKLSRSLPASQYYPEECIGDVEVKSTDGIVSGSSSQTTIRVQVLAMNNTSRAQTVYLQVGVGAAYGDGALYQTRVFKQRYPIMSTYVYNRTGVVQFNTPSRSALPTRAYSFSCEDPQPAQMADYTVSPDTSWPYTMLTTSGLRFDLSAQANRDNLLDLVTGVLKAAQTTSTIRFSSTAVPQLNGTVWEIDDRTRADLWKYLITSSAGGSSLGIRYKQ